MSRITATFAQLERPALIPFLTAGDPHPDWTVALLHQAVASGADAIELGIPFSDPMADGPTIAQASERAIAKRVDTAVVLDMVREFRQRNDHTPIIAMGYLNPLVRYGEQRFAQEAQAAGIDGLLMVDTPTSGGNDATDALYHSGLDRISLIAPTTDKARRQQILAKATGYVYFVALKGVTGAALTDFDQVASSVQAIRADTDLPVAVGFGIKDEASAATVGDFADGVVIGSALIEQLVGCGDLETAEADLDRFLKPIADRLHLA